MAPFLTEIHFIIFIGGFSSSGSIGLKNRNGEKSVFVWKKSRQIQMRQILASFFYKIWKVRQNNEFKFRM